MEQQDRYARYTSPDEEGPQLGVLMEALVDDAKGYLETQRDLATLNASEKAGRAVSVTVLMLMVMLLVGGVLVMLSIALALWLGELLGSLTLGFLATAGIHLLLTALFYLLWRATLREKIIVSIINAIHGND